MGRPKGSKVVPCPKCGTRVVAIPGETGVCTHCQTKVKFTQKLMKEIDAKKSATVQKPAAKKAPAPAPVAAAPAKRGRKPKAAVVESEPVADKKRKIVLPPPKKVQVIQSNKKASPTTEEAPKRRGRPPKAK